MNTTTLHCVFWTALISGCAAAPGRIDEAQRARLAASVDSATRAFEDAQRDRDAERVVAHLAPDFYMYNDGRRISYDAVVAGMQETFGMLRHLEPGFRDIEVNVVGPAAAVVSLTFRDSVVTATGDLMQLSGPTTLVWEQRGDDWLITYADADHYPLERGPPDP